MAPPVPVWPASVLASGPSARRVLIDDGPPSHLFSVFPHVTHSPTYARAHAQRLLILPLHGKSNK